jgi:hypothetical protein
MGGNSFNKELKICWHGGRRVDPDDYATVAVFLDRFFIRHQV